jgi:anti-anti-sigma regulatory factor
MGRLKEILWPPLLEAERQRRMELFRTFFVVQLVATVGLLASGFLDSADNLLNLLAVGGVGLLATLFTLVGYRLARQRGWLRGGIILTQVGLLACLGFFVVFYGTRGSIPYFFIWPILLGAILLDTAQAFLITTVIALFYGGFSLIELNQVWEVPLFRPERFAYWHRPAESEIIYNFLSSTIEVIIVYYAAAFLSWIASRSQHRLMERFRSQSEEVALYRSELEERIAEQGQITTRLQTSLELVHQVGSPVLPIFEGVILAPLIGEITTERARIVMDRILEETTKERAQAVIVDITGVPIVDTAVANALILAAQGVRLLGAMPILVGIRAEVAETMVELGVDLRGIVTRSSLQEGLQYALQSMGVQVLAEKERGELPLLFESVRERKR